jgi:peptidoglycan/LPS O-acetylase OafA/YrhL
MLAAVLVGTRLPHTRLPHLLWLGGTFAAALAVGFAFYAWVELPLLNLVKRRGRPPAGRAAGPVAPPAPARRAA